MFTLDYLIIVLVGVRISVCRAAAGASIRSRQRWRGPGGIGFGLGASRQSAAGPARGAVGRRAPRLRPPAPALRLAHHHGGAEGQRHRGTSTLPAGQTAAALSRLGTSPMVYSATGVKRGITVFGSYELTHSAFCHSFVTLVEKLPVPGQKTGWQRTPEWGGSHFPLEDVNQLGPANGERLPLTVSSTFVKALSLNLSTGLVKIASLWIDHL